MSEIAFFPWFKIDEPIEIGDFELLIYHSQGSLSIQDDLDNIIGDFYPYEKREVKNCVLLKPKSKKIGEDFTEEERNKIFVFSELLTFSGLAARAFFWGSMGGYSNKDVYQIIVRKYERSGDGYKIRNRRRDGYTETIVSKGATKIRKQKHIQSFIKTPINFDLLNSLYQGSQTLNDEKWNSFYESIIVFNLANTDSQYVRDEMEIVLLFSSFERLFNVGKNTKDLFKLFEKILNPATDIKPEECVRISKLKDKSRFKSTKTLRKLWLKDFNNLRGNLAHGRYDNKYPSLWSIHEHLLYASFILPICVKIRLSQLGLYEISESDTDSIEIFEQLLSIQPFNVTDNCNPWLNSFSEYRIKRNLIESFDS